MPTIPRLNLTKNIDSFHTTINRWADTVQEAINTLDLRARHANNTANIVQATQPTFLTNGVKNTLQSRLNLVQGAGTILTPDGSGDITIASSATGDGIIHGELPWETDPSYVFMRDDFRCFNSNSATSLGTSLGDYGNWILTAGTSVGSCQTGGFPPYLGVVAISMPPTTNVGGQLSPLNIGASSSNALSFAWPLIEYPSWKQVYVFQLNEFFPNGGSGSELLSGASLTKKSLYVGMSGDLNNPTSASKGRPACFCGVRYDTDPGLSLTLSAAATASGGNTVYTGTITSGGSSVYAGQFFTVAGFTNAANNGRFLCVASSTTTLTLQNGSGVAETHAGTAKEDAISDTKFQFECVANTQIASYVRNNRQGNVISTGITPAFNVWYRLEISCDVAGQIKFSMVGSDGTSSGVQTVTMPQYSYSDAAGTANVIHNVGNIVIGTGTIPPPFVYGTKVTASAGPNFSGTWTLATGNTGSAQQIFFYAPQLAGDTFSGATSGSGYAGMFPIFSCANDTSASPLQTVLFVDFFSFAWNPGVNGGSGIPSSAKPRYF